MSIVTDPRGNRIIFCEGEPGGPDIILWGRVLTGARHPEADDFRIEIIPMGGKQAAKNFARGYGIAISNDNWRVIRDRDLDDTSSDENTVVIWDNGKTLLTGATCLESYFLLPELMQEFISDHSDELDLSLLPNNHDAQLQQALYELKDYQAVRWALQEIRKAVQVEAEKNSLYRTAGTFDLPNRLTDVDGKLPADLSLNTCTSSAQQLVDQFRNTFHAIDGNKLKAHIEEFKSRFNGESFRTTDWRYWFHGKDVLKFWLKSYPNIGYDKYCRWAANNLDWHQFVDLVEIQRLCQT